MLDGLQKSNQNELACGYGAFFCIAVFCLNLLVEPLSAAPIVDQHYQETNIGTIYGMTELTRAQTFTVGLKGTLVGFDIDITGCEDYPCDPIWSGQYTTRWEIHSTNNGMPILTSMPLAWDEVTYGPDRGIVYADIASFNLQVQVGDVLAIVLPGINDGLWPPYRGLLFGDLAGQYERGELYSTTDYSPDAYVSTASDIYFNTYVVPVSVPEPQIVRLFGIGLLGIVIGYVIPGFSGARGWSRRAQ